jgi:hypothetical protein
MKAARSSETSVLARPTQLYFPEDGILYLSPVFVCIYIYIYIRTERGPLSLVSTIQELLGRKSSGSGLENREYGRRDSSR